MTHPLVVSFGGGVNSAAMLAGMRERGIRPDLILFADTGGEKPETYAFVETMRRWTIRHLDIGIVAVSAAGKFDSLEDRCLKQRHLPSIAYGFRSCSQRWKHEPQEKYCNNWEVSVTAWKAGRKITKAIGYDAGELRRHHDITQDDKYLYWYPLMEWGWDRASCILAIERAGLRVPPKSACFYCPASKKQEVLELRLNHPDLFDRAVAIERAAADYNKSVKGLGRHWSWEDIVAADESQFKMFPETVQIPCMCFDGAED